MCGYDALTWDKYIAHHRKTKHRTVCQGCNDGKGTAWPANSDEYLDHLQDENVCDVCEEHFMTFSTLNHVIKLPVWKNEANSISSTAWFTSIDRSNAMVAIGNSSLILR